METTAITKYVELSHEHVRAIESLAPAERLDAITAELDALWVAMDRDEKDETERRLGELLVHSAMYEDLQCHTCSRVVLTHRRCSPLPWRPVGTGVPLHCRTGLTGRGYRFTLCQECATKALEACVGTSYEQILADYEIQRQSESGMPAVFVPEGNDLQRALIENQGSLLTHQEEQIADLKVLVASLKKLDTSNRATIASLKKLDESAERTISLCREESAASVSLIKNQESLIRLQNDRIAELERLVAIFGHSLPERPSA